MKPTGGLKATPFHKSIAPDRLFTWPASQELQKRLQYMKTARGIMLVTGLPAWVRRPPYAPSSSALPTTTFLPLYLTLSALTTHDFYRQLNQALGGEPRGRKCELYACLQHSVASTVARQQVPVVIFDEAHLLAHDVLHELQILANYQMDSVDPMLWVFLAQLHLRDRLSRVVFQSFHQRIALRYHLDPLDAEQTQAYVRHHLKVCGRSEPIFTEPAFAALFQTSGGILRVLGSVALKALTLGALEKKTELTEEEVLRAAGPREAGRRPIHP